MQYGMKVLVVCFFYIKYQSFIIFILSIIFININKRKVKIGIFTVCVFQTSTKFVIASDYMGTNFLLI